MHPTSRPKNAPTARPPIDASSADTTATRNRLAVKSAVKAGGDDHVDEFDPQHNAKRLVVKSSVKAGAIVGDGTLSQHNAKRLVVTPLS
jgi:hypothetical protein